MVLIRNESDLTNLGRPLNDCDALEFHINGKVLNYRVYGNYCEDGCGNDTIFKELGFTTETDKKNFATTYYGYEARGGGWPETISDDKIALTKLIKEIYRRISLGIVKPEWKAGMKIRMTDTCNGCVKGEVYTLMEESNTGRLRARHATDGCSCKANWLMIEEAPEVVQMELNEIKKINLTEAAKQVQAEKINAEIAFAKQKFVEAQNRVDELDRQIKQAEEAKKPYLEILAKFK